MIIFKMTCTLNKENNMSIKIQDCVDDQMVPFKDKQIQAVPNQ